MTENKGSPQATTAAGASAALENLLVLLDELNAVVDEENKLLARGLPASLSTYTARKNELADEFEMWTKTIAANHLALWTADESRRATFLGAVARLHKAMDENVERLRAAIDASRRRIDAVMRAIKAEFRAASPYGANGRVNGPSSSSVYGGNGLSI